MAAAMTYFSMLSLAPCLVIAIAMAGYFFGNRLAEQEIIEQVQYYTTEKIAGIVAGLMANASQRNSGALAGSISIVILLFGASGVFTQLQETFNEIWDVPHEERQGIWLTVQTRLAGILMVVVSGFLLLTTLGLSTAVATVTNFFADKFPRTESWLAVADRGISFLLMPLVLSLMFWLVPRADVRWRDVWPAAMLTATLLSFSRYLIEIYLQYSTTSELYGAAGSLVILLIWIYMSGLVLFYGAAFSRAWTEIYGSRATSADEPASRKPATS